MTKLQSHTPIALKSVFFIMLFLLHLSNYGQVHKIIDSLQHKLKTAPPKESADIYNQLAGKYFSVSLDTTLIYAQIAIDLAQKYNQPDQTSTALLAFAEVQYQRGNYDSAMHCINQAYELDSTYQNKNNLAECYNYYGIVFEGMGEYSKALQYYEKSLQINTELNSPEGLSKNYNNIGMIYYNLKEYKTAIQHFQKAISIDSAAKMTTDIPIMLNNIGLSYYNLGFYEKGLDYFITALDLSNKLGIKNSTSAILNNIGLVYYKMNNLNKAIEYFKKSLEIAKVNNDKNSMINELSNISGMYQKQLKYDITLKYLDSAMVIAQSANLRVKIRSLYVSYSRLYEKMQQTDKALFYLKKFAALNDSIFKEDTQKEIAAFQSKYENEKKQKEINQKNVLLLKKQSQINRQRWIIALFITGLVFVIFFIFLLKKQIKEKKQAYEKLEQQNEEITAQKEEILAQSNQLEITNKELEKLSVVASKTDNAVVITDSIGNLIWVNEGFEKMFGYSLKEFRNNIGKSVLHFSSDSNINKEIVNAIQARKNYNYVFNFKNKTNNTIWVQSNLTPLFYSDGSLKQLIIINTDITAIKNAEFEILKQKVEIKKQHQQLEVINATLEQQKEEILAQRDEIENKNIILQQINNEIAVKNENITASIKYARRIQRAIFTPESIINGLFNDFFIIYRPKDYVSGDFYWFQKISAELTNENYEDLILFAVADCTGHGVPGALMSIIGFNLLNQAVLEHNLTNPAGILNNLSNNLYKSLHHTDIEAMNVKDGMDIALCALNTKTMQLQFSGAFNPIYILRNNELLSFKGDLYPIGVPFEDDFKGYTNQQISVNKGDRIYLFTDGITDQYSDDAKQKFLRKGLKKALLEMQHLKIKQQKILLEYTLKKWQGNYEQTDDMLILGIEI